MDENSFHSAFYYYYISLLPAELLPEYYIRFPAADEVIDLQFDIE